MNCPLQNIRLQECLSQDNILNTSEGKTQEHWNQLISETPCFSRYENAQKNNISFQTKVQESSSDRSSPFSEKNDALLKYLQSSLAGAQENLQKQEENDYSFQLGELKHKIMQIQQLSQAQIVRLKKQLQEERMIKEQPKKVLVSIGVNTQQDPKDEEISILKEMLKQQCLLNKQLLKQSFKIKQQFGLIKLTKN